MAHPSASPALFTIGYEGKTSGEYLAQLQRAGVTLLCDVRRNPISRKPGFSRKALLAACAGHGIRYEHLPELGIASSDRKAIQTAEDRDRLFERYTRETLPREKAALKKIQHWIAGDKHRLALTCFERDACECHRHCIADLLARETAFPAPVHL